MFTNRFTKEIDDGEKIKKAIALLKPQTDKLSAEADAERMEKQRNLRQQLNALIQQREAESLDFRQRHAKHARKKKRRAPQHKRH